MKRNFKVEIYDYFWYYKSVFVDQFFYRPVGEKAKDLFRRKSS